MRVLLDECSPLALKSYLRGLGHECRTAQEEGWSGRRNGELLALAEQRFDVSVTVDANLRFQQNLGGRRIAVVILRGWSNRLVDLTPHFPACAAAIEGFSPGVVTVIGVSG
jgi:predicted nuclease of predicted toxin-antitoxin system